jgi:hypothetical protein
MKRPRRFAVEIAALKNQGNDAEALPIERRDSH